MIKISVCKVSTPERSVYGVMRENKLQVITKELQNGVRE